MMRCAGSMVAEVGGNGVKSAATAFDTAARVLHRGAADASDARASLGERQGDALTDAGVGPGDDRGLARKIE